jgi:hypothetical protein
MKILLKNFVIFCRRELVIVQVMLNQQVPRAVKKVHPPARTPKNSRRYYILHYAFTLIAFFDEIYNFYNYILS